MSQHQRPWQSVWRNPETRQKRAFAPFQRGGLGPHGKRWYNHLIVIIQSDNQKTRTNPNVAIRAAGFKALSPNGKPAAKLCDSMKFSSGRVREPRQIGSLRGQTCEVRKS